MTVNAEVPAGTARAPGPARRSSSTTRRPSTRTPARAPRSTSPTRSADPLTRGGGQDPRARPSPPSVCERLRSARRWTTTTAGAPAPARSSSASFWCSSRPARSRRPRPTGRGASGAGSGHRPSRRPRSPLTLNPASPDGPALPRRAGGRLAHRDQPEPGQPPPRHARPSTPRRVTAASTSTPGTPACDTSTFAFTSQTNGGVGWTAARLGLAPGHPAGLAHHGRRRRQRLPGRPGEGVPPGHVVTHLPRGLRRRPLVVLPIVLNAPQRRRLGLLDHRFGARRQRCRRGDVGQ